MKKILFVMPLMAISLVGCNKGGGDDPGPTYTITFNCTDCKAYDESDKEVTSVTVPAVDPAQSLYKEFHFEGNKPYKVPLKSNISIKKTGTDETVEYKYSGGNIFIPVVGNLTVTAAGSTYHKDLETSSWDEIAEISATGRADEFFKVGDTKQVTLKDQSFSHTVRIIGFNHDDLADGSGKAGITFEFANLITNGSKTEPTALIWDGYYDVSGDNFDYRQSFLNSYLNSVIVNYLPDDLGKEGIIRPVNKLVGVNETETAGKDNYKATSFDGLTYPKLFSLAYNELRNLEGSSENVVPGEAGDPATGAGIYEYYAKHGGTTDEDNAYRIKDIVGGAGASGRYYWLRSPASNVSSFVFVVTNEGDLGSTSVFANKRAVAPAFCI